MENSNGFERFSDLWKKADMDSVSQKKYSEQEINTLKMKKSADFSQALNKSILFDFMMKGLLVTAMPVLIWYYRANFPVIIILTILIAFSLFLLKKEYSIREKFLSIDDLSKEISAVLKAKIQFYKNTFPKLNLMLAFSNALFVWVGSMFYYYAKYGDVKMEDFTDLLVSALVIGTAFAISYYTLTFQYRYYVLELNECLAELSDEQKSTMTIKRQSRRKKVFILIAVLAVVIGALLFGYILIF